MLGGLAAAALLPARQRDRVAFRLDLPLASWAGALSVAAAVAGGIAWAIGWLVWMEEVTGNASQAAVAAPRGASVGGLMFLGPLQALAYLFTPLGLALGYVTLTSLARAVVWTATREVPGDPLVALGFAAGRGLRRLERRRRAGTLLSAGPPDVVRATGEDTLEIACAEARPDLALGGTVEVDGRFYEITAVRQERARVVYALRELAPESVLRGLVRYRRDGAT